MACQHLTSARDWSREPPAGRETEWVSNDDVLGADSQIIAKTLKISGNGTVILDWDVNAVAEKAMIALVE